MEIQRGTAGCGSFHVGHDVHPIQGRKSIEAGVRRPCTVKVEDDGWLTVTVDDGVVERLWHHTPEILRQALAQTGNRAERRAFHVLAFCEDSAEEHYRALLFSVAEEPTPCPDPDEEVSGLDPAELILKRGGFLLPGDEVDRRSDGSPTPGGRSRKRSSS